MQEIRLELNSNQKGAFVIKENNAFLAEMAISIKDGNLTVFHTEVAGKRYWRKAAGCNG